MFLFFSLFFIFAKADAGLQPCFENTKPWPVHPGHFYDKDIHLVPSLPADKPGAKKQAANYLAGYSVVFVRADGPYEKLGIRSGDLVTGVDGTDLDPYKNGIDSKTEMKLLAKIKAGKKFTLLRCLKPTTIP